MRQKKIWHGYRFKTYVVLEEAPKENRTRRAYVRCLACGDEKIVNVQSISSKKLAACKCGYDVPTFLPYGQGIACQARTPTCEINENGACCYWCDEKENCNEACLNMPDKCGSFYASKEAKK